MTHEVVKVIQTFGDMRVGDMLRRPARSVEDDDDRIRHAIKKGEIVVDPDGYIYLPVLSVENRNRNEVSIVWGNWLSNGGSTYDRDGSISGSWTAVRVRHLIHEPEELPI